MTRAGNRVETRKKLLEAAAGVYSERGWEGKLMALVARRAGYTTGAVYGIFENKDDLLASMLEERAQELIDALRKKVGAAKTLPEKLTVLRQWYGRRLEQFTVRGRLSLDLTLRAHENPVLRERMKRIYDNGRQVLAAAIEEVAKANGRKVPVPAADVSALLFAMFEGILIQQIVDGDNAVLDVFFGLADKLAALRVLG